MDPLHDVGITAQFDQAASGARHIAGLLGAYFKALVDEGLTRDEALVIVVEYQMWLLTVGKGN